MSFSEKSRRFLEPLWSFPLLTFLSLVKYMSWTFYALYSVYMIRESTHTFTTADWAGLEHLIWQYAGISILFLISGWYLRAVDFPMLHMDIQKWILKKYLDTFMHVDGTYIEKMGTGRIISILQTGANVWGDGLINMLKEGTKVLIMSTFILFVFFSKNFFYGVLFIVLFAGLQWLVIHLDSHAHRYRRIRTEQKSDLTRRIVRIIMARNEIIQSMRGTEEIEGVIEIHDAIKETNFGVNKALFAIFNLIRVFVIVGKIGILVWVVIIGYQGYISVADMAGMLTLFVVFENFLHDAVEFYKNFTKDFSDIEKLWETFDFAPQNTRFDTGKEFHFHRGDFHLENISFSYNSQENAVFRDFSLSIEGGKKTALVGHSGSGKTTLMKMLAGYLEPTRGKIFIDGEDFSEIALRSYYEHVGYLTQEPAVFDATIRENLMSAISKQVGVIDSVQKEGRNKITRGSKKSQSYHPSPKISGKEFEIDVLGMVKGVNSPVSPSAIHPLKRGGIGNGGDGEREQEDEKLIEALTLAHCDFVFSLEKGIDTEIGERGVRLSGGQKQRLAIAKIFLKNPGIILLDEPTSALDSFSEEAVTYALDNLFEGRTVIIIAHRLQTVKKADDIIVFEEGKVVERGDHFSLTEKRGIYAKMLELQSGF